MVFYPPDWVPKLPFDPPDDTPIHDFMFDEKHGRRPINKSLPTFVDGLSGKSYTPQHTRDRVEWLARALQKRLGWSIDTLPNKLGGELGGDERAVDPNKVVCLFTLNTVDTLLSSNTMFDFEAGWCDLFGFPHDSVYETIPTTLRIDCGRLPRASLANTPLDRHSYSIVGCSTSQWHQFPSKRCILPQRAHISARVFEVKGHLHLPSSTIYGNGSGKKGWHFSR